MAPGSDWRLCEGATYKVYTDGGQDLTDGIDVVRVTPHPWLHWDGVDQNDHEWWATQRYNLVLVHLRRPLTLRKTLRPVCIPSPEEEGDLRGLMQAIGSGFISGYNRRIPNPFQLLTLGIDFLGEEECVEWWKGETEVGQPLGDRLCGRNSPNGTLLNPEMICIPMDGGTVVRVGNRTLLLGFTNEYFRNPQKERCDEEAKQFISILNANSTAWIRRGQVCGALQFACSDGSCILNRNLCDGMTECSDGGDEDERYCKPRNCCLPGVEFACGVYGQCIPSFGGVGNCNGVVDCPKGEDEDSAICPKTTKSTAQKLGIGVGVASGVGLTCSVGLFVVYFRRRRRREKVS